MFLKELTKLSGVSGCEYEVRNFIKEKLNNIGCEYYTDKLGNVIAHNKGIKTKTIMLAAHMDEVGLIVSNIDSNGFIKFQAVGGIDQRVLNSKVVEVGEKKIPGVIGSKAVHLMSDDEKGKSLSIDKLYIDIGSSSKQETEKLVNVGDYVSFKSDYVEFGDDMIKAKALDDRVGCSILLELLSMKLNIDFYAVFTVMEEVGCRGAYAAAYKLEPELGIVIEGTICADMPEVKDHLKATTIGNGAVISIMDNGTIYNEDDIKYVANLARDNEISYQFRKLTSGSNDSKSIQTRKGGCRVISLAMPCRYIHSPISVGNKKDYQSILDLTKIILQDQNKYKGE